MEYSREAMLERLEESTRTLTPPEVAEILGRPTRTVYDMIQKGAFGDVETRPGGRMRVPYSNIERYIKSAEAA